MICSNTITLQHKTCKQEICKQSGLKVTHPPKHECANIQLNCSEMPHTWWRMQWLTWLEG